MSYDCPNCGKPVPSDEEFRELPPEQRKAHWCDSHVTAETIRRIVREVVKEEVLAALRTPWT